MSCRSFNAESDSSEYSDSDSLEDQENLRAFRDMFNTVLDHKYPNGKWNYVQTSTIFYSINGGKPGTLKNVPWGTHTEVVLIRQLQERGTSIKDSIHVEVYSNNSPCSECAEVLLDFLNENQTFILTFYVAHLYNIFRQSCIKNQEDHVTRCRVTKYESERNKESLCKLLENGRCKIKAFREETWIHLINMLNLRDENHSFQDKYKEKQDADDRSRMEEDQLVNQDLRHMFCKYVLDCMFYMGLYDDDSSSHEYLVYRVNKNKAEMRKYTTQIGKDLMQELEETYDGKTMHVIIHASRSPCTDDVQSLLKFLKEKRQAKVTFYVANVFGIRRNSCKKGTYYEDVSEEASTKNSDGLRELMDHRRCELKVFIPPANEVWGGI